MISLPWPLFTLALFAAACVGGVFGLGFGVFIKEAINDANELSECPKVRAVHGDSLHDLGNG